jgi:hypothetical protein
MQTAARSIPPAANTRRKKRAGVDGIRWNVKKSARDPRPLTTALAASRFHPTAAIYSPAGQEVFFDF